MAIFNSYYKWPFSIAMLVYQRVCKLYMCDMASLCLPWRQCHETTKLLRLGHAAWRCKEVVPSPATTLRNHQRPGLKQRHHALNDSIGHWPFLSIPSRVFVKFSRVNSWLWDHPSGWLEAGRPRLGGDHRYRGKIGHSCCIPHIPKKSTLKYISKTTD